MFRILILDNKQGIIWRLKLGIDFQGSRFFGSDIDRQGVVLLCPAWSDCYHMGESKWIIVFPSPPCWSPEGIQRLREIKWEPQVGLSRTRVLRSVVRCHHQYLHGLLTHVVGTWHLIREKYSAMAIVYNPVSWTLTENKKKTLWRKYKNLILRHHMCHLLH